MIKKILTLFIPAYNSEKYLNKCLSTMLNPAYPEVEILIIDDGSKDSTGMIADQYALEYPEIVKVIHKQNGGWGSGVNLAIREAKGLFFKIVDADDFLSDGALQNLLELLKKAEPDVDMIATNYHDYFADSNSFVKKEIAPELVNRTFSMEDLTNKYQGLWGTPIHAITHRTELLRRVNCVVNDRYYADLQYILLPMLGIRKIHFSDLYLSCYYHGSEGQSTSISGYKKNYRDLLKVALSLSETYENKKIQTGLHRLLKHNIIPQIKFCYYILMHPDYVGGTETAKQDLLEFDRSLKEKSPLLYRKSFWILRRRIPYIMIWRLFRINIFLSKR